MERSVANLTTEQLYRKRALDRVNQRASRARKKSRIQELEEEVGDLKKRLAQSEERVKQLECSEVSLRQAIDSARTSLRLIDAASALPAGIPTPAPSTTAAPSANGDHSPIVNVSSPCAEPGQDASHLASVSSAGASSDGNVTGFNITHEGTGFTIDLPFSTGGESPFNFWPGGFPSDPSSMSGFSLSLDPFPPEGDASTWVSQTADIQITDANSPTRPIWERLPLHVNATCRLDEVILDLIRTTRQREQHTGPIPELTGPSFPSIKSLLNPEQESTNNSISNAIGQHGRITMRLPRITEKVAAMYLICTYLRWLISPNKQNYEAIPEFLRPVESQLTIPHPVWIDVMVWPEARQSIITTMDWTEFYDLRELSNASLSVNWPHDDPASIFTARSKSELGLNPQFEQHIRQVSNWTWGSNVSARYPFLNCVPVKDDPSRPSGNAGVMDDSERAERERFKVTR
ncbi:hypothetical protein BU24DRAFT_423217 [Aaosphaeria arxii CBS 175.79]|uniref:BZIP domain-containing protein n=1 Tax=Aaosphaeria arxii CBS 175.79 TaxID=1450172 RepID=A0A6A5XMQ0_9PLEO|nr:uncharacterized protein BU24DRAFT_423217 [Aaosphaeria arxii CBS 175.79]KAF2014186.1 hypothetical protein BU24DRAFT_423217 [Aaosphaeria arxii CBS 175.79]